MILPGENGSGHCGDATMLRDNPEGSSSRCSASREVLPPRCTLDGRKSSHDRPLNALKTPPRRGRNLNTNGERRFSISR